MDRNLADVKEVIETNSQEEVNIYLNAGYLLIDTANGKWSDSGEPYIKYSLGWFKDLPAPKPQLW